MPKTLHLPQIQYSYGNRFILIVFGLIDSCIGFTLILLIYFFEFNNKILSHKEGNYTLNKNSITSPSFTTYSLPSLLSNPLVFAFAIEPDSIKF